MFVHFASRANASPEAGRGLLVRGTRTDGVDVLLQRPVSPAESGCLATSHQSLMPQQGHVGCNADADNVREGRTQSASTGGDEGAVVPQLSLPPASRPLSCSRRQAHTPSEAGRVAARHTRGATVGGTGMAVGSISSRASGLASRGRFPCKSEESG